MVKKYLDDGYENIAHPEVGDVNLYKDQVSSGFLKKREKLSDVGKIDLIKSKRKVDVGNNYATERILKTKHDKAVKSGEARRSVSFVVPSLPWKK